MAKTERGNVYNQPEFREIIEEVASQTGVDLKLVRTMLTITARAMPEALAGTRDLSIIRYHLKTDETFKGYCKRQEIDQEVAVGLSIDLARRLEGVEGWGLYVNSLGSEIYRDGSFVGKVSAKTVLSIDKWRKLVRRQEEASANAAFGVPDEILPGMATRPSSPSGATRSQSTRSQRSSVFGNEKR